MKTLIARRLFQVKPSPTLAIVKKAALLREQGHRILSLSVGEPDFDTPINIKNAAKKALDDGKTKYTPEDGTSELKKAIIRKLQRENGLNYAADEVMASAGAKQILFNALFATLNPEDEVIIPTPYWVSYPDMVLLAGGKPVFLTAQEDFSIDLKDLASKITLNTKWLILNSPSNPSGMVYSKELLRGLAEILLQHPQIFIMSDDIYEHVIFDREFYNIPMLEPKLRGRTLVVNGVSKAYAMTGWRLGYGAGPVELINAMSKIQSQVTSCPSSISQAAAVEALNGDQSFIAEMNRIFAKKRDLTMNLLNQIPGLSCRRTDGAFYLMVNCQSVFGKKTPTGKILHSDQDVVEYLLEDALVAAVHGSVFGMGGFFRVSYATSEEILIEAAEKIKFSMQKLNEC